MDGATSADAFEYRLLAGARADAIELTASLPEAELRRSFVESALAEIDELGVVRG